MAELADAADSKSAGLRPLGVRFPLPAPPGKAAPDAGFSQFDLGKTGGIQTPLKWPCDRAVTGDGRNQTHWKVVGLDSLASSKGDKQCRAPGLLQLGVLGFGLFEDGDVGIGVLPDV